MDEMSAEIGHMRTHKYTHKHTRMHAHTHMNAHTRTRNFKRPFANKKLKSFQFFFQIKNCIEQKKKPIKYRQTNDVLSVIIYLSKIIPGVRSNMNF